MTARVDVPRRVLDQPQKNHEEPAAKHSGFQTAHGSELVRDAVVLEPRQTIYPSGGRPRRDLQVALFTPAQLDYKDRQIQKEQWSEEEQYKWHKDKVGQVLQSPRQRRFAECS